MKAVLLEQLGSLVRGTARLELAEIAAPVPGEGEVLVQVAACGVCHTELDEIEGRTPPARLPMVPGHQAVGRVVAAGPGATAFRPGDRIGVAWIASACGRCPFCREGRENLCPDFRATGRDVPGGYAELLTVREDFAHAIPTAFSDVEAAPLLCAGAIGYRSLHLTGLTDGQSLGLTGFGASAHLVLQMVRHRFPRTRVYVFARDEEERRFARELGAVWAGGTEERSPEPLAAILDTTPAWKPVVEALANLAPGGRLVINAIRKQEEDKNELLALDYPRHLWLEKTVQSVANVTRSDVRDFLALAAEAGLRPEVEVYPLDRAAQALLDLQQKRVRGAKVLRIG